MFPTWCSTEPGGAAAAPPSAAGGCGWGDVMRGPFCPKGCARGDPCWPKDGCNPHVPTDLYHVSVNMTAEMELSV